MATPAVGTVVVVEDAVAALDTTHGHALLREWSARGITVTTTAHLLG